MDNRGESELDPLNELFARDTRNLLHHLGISTDGLSNRELGALLHAKTRETYGLSSGDTFEQVVQAQITSFLENYQVPSDTSEEEMTELGEVLYDGRFNHPEESDAVAIRLELGLLPEATGDEVLAQLPHWVSRKHLGYLMQCNEEVGRVSMARLIGLQSETISRLRGYGRLQSGWDGYRGKTFPREFLSFVNDISNRIFCFLIVADFAPDEVVTSPASDGSLDIDFRFKDRALELTFDPDTKDRVQVVCREFNTTVSDEQISADDLDKRISWFVGAGSAPATN